ncbi:uncharacterized protein LOC127882166 isoform X2 [Dreissena polymorpha]|uniref:uncharacterized protein LOC127882166 isoform X2 n=1 Tax=Dreissena polymorpha TaxID=45954 RepID=UPI0022651883|nr:uncharacterized protein LOC127882166 isoform X2 [Dreissena polymorpha]
MDFMKMGALLFPFCNNFRTVQLDEDDLPYRKGSNATIRSEGTGTEYYTKHGLLSSYDSQETIKPSSRPVSTASNSSMRVRRLSSLTDDNTRFPKLQDCAHFHYDLVDINSLKVSLCEEDKEHYHHSSEPTKYFYIKISSNNKTWLARRTLRNFRMLDQKLHRCIFDRKFSHLPEVSLIEKENISEEELYLVLQEYLSRFTNLAGSMLNCGSVLNWLEIDNRGNRLLAVDDSGINTPAIAAAHAIKRYTAQAADEISLEVGDIISVIDMPPTDDTIWWRGKRGFEVGFFPYECVELIGDKVPQAVVSSIPETPHNRALLKKHGKFISFLRLFFNTRPERIQLKQSGIVKERVFGCDLGEHLLNSGHDVPLVLKSCTDVIETHGLVDGIYRLSGITSNIQKLRLAFDEDRVPDLTSEEYLQDVHSISSLLKMYFRELPNPLLTYQLYDKFANAVKDDDNKLLRIHDVVQQLPPPHYRTTEYLMRHLARVAAHGHETGMHSKNLAIVWAPNLLRSKELESGGGAAALQGVGIQAVVTEFLILYADLIFSDKMPSYSTPQLKKTQKKPRPKSLAISTPTRLLSLEEARERALMGGFVKPDQRYIDVGGGPENLPAKYHTVIDLPGYKKKGSSKDKGKKSPGGLKSLFTKSRSGSVRQKGRKAQSIHESLNFDIGDRKAITEEDVQHWKRRRIRSAKSAESLLSLPVTSRLGSPLSESLDPNRLMNILAGKEHDSPTKKYSRSASTESPHTLTSPRPLTMEFSISFPSFVLEDDNCREMAIDVNPKDIELDFSSELERASERESSESPEGGVHRKQSFVRNDQKRRVICHRRIPSAPTTPKQDNTPTEESSRDYEVSDKDKSLSLQALDVRPKIASRSNSTAGRIGGEAERFFVHSITPAGVGGVGQSSFVRSGEENGSEKRKGSKTPPKDRKKLKEEKHNSPSMERARALSIEECVERSESDTVSSYKSNEIISELPESPGCKRKLWSGSTASVEEPNKSSVTDVKYKVVRRNHDYAEIDESKMIDILTDKHSSSEQLSEDTNRDSKSNSAISLSTDRARHYRVESIDNVVASSSSVGTLNSVLETDFPARAKVLQRAKTFESEESMRRNEDLLLQISELEQGLKNIKKREPGKSITKCVSIPLDIQKSLENIRSHSGSHSDITSSLTISELSVSQDNVFSVGDANGVNTERRRRSTSLDGLHDESPLCRTLKEINAQIDMAFKSEKHKAQTLREMQAAHKACLTKQSSYESYDSHHDELNVTPTGHRSFGSMRDSDVSPSDYENPVCNVRKSESENLRNIDQNIFVERPKSEIHIADAPKVIKAPTKLETATPVTMTTPTRPSPPASLDIVSTMSSNNQPGNMLTKSNSISAIESEMVASLKQTSNLPPSKTGFRMSEEDFQKILMADPDSLKQFEQSMMYSPVRARVSKAFPDDRSARSSIASPLEGVIPRSRSNRSSLASPEGSPGMYRQMATGRGMISPETSPLASRPPRSHGGSSIESSPQQRQKQTSHQLTALEISPKSRQKSKLPVPSSMDTSPTSKQKLNTSFSSSEGSPQPRQKQNTSFSCVEGSPQSCRQKLNQSFSCLEVSPPMRQKQNNQSISSSDSSPQVKQRLNQSTSSSEPSPQTSRSRLNQSYSSAEESPVSSARQSHNQSEVSCQLGSRQPFGVMSPQSEVKRFDPKSPLGYMSDESPSYQRRSAIGRAEQHSGMVSSPLSPEHKQPRWEDLAGLNESFKEIDMSVFNDNWKRCLAPTGDSIRQSNKNSADSSVCENDSTRNEFPEVSTGTDTLVLERPSITRKVTAQVKTDQPLENTTAAFKARELETYDNVSEQEVLLIQTRTPANRPVAIAISPKRTVVRRSQTLPESSSQPQSPMSARSGITSPVCLLEHSNSFESSATVFGPYRGLPVEALEVEHPAITKSSTSPALARQTSFDSSVKQSVRVTSLGSFEELNREHAATVATSNVPSKGFTVTISSNESNQSEVTTGSGFKRTAANQSSVNISTRQSNQASVLIRSEKSQSADYCYSDLNNSSVSDQANTSHQTSIGTLLPQMLEEMDVNESCLGIASHQNMSNEMKEMMQEQIRGRVGSILSPLDEVMAPFSNIGSPRLNQRSFFDASHPLAGFDMESSIEIPADIGLVSLPEVHIQYLSDGPTLIATPMVLNRLHFSPSCSQPHQPVDNTEEEFQNAINDDLERNLASLRNYLPQHANVCEPGKLHTANCGDPFNLNPLQNLGDSFVCGGDSGDLQRSIYDNNDCHAPLVEHLVLIPPVTVMDTPPPVMQDSMSSSSSSQVDLMSTSFTYPQNFDSWHYYSPVVNSLSIQGDIAPPPLEMIEICKSVVVRSKPPTGKDKPIGKHLQWEYPKILDKDVREVVKKKTEKLKSESSHENVSSERGEEILIMDNRPRLRRTPEGQRKAMPGNVCVTDLVDSDQGENSAAEDDVFVDPSEVTPQTNFFAAGSKYFKRRDFLSYGHYPGLEDKGRDTETGGRVNRVFSFEMPPRVSPDEDMLQRNHASDRLKTEVRNDLMDIGHEGAEDIRFSKAHKSSKLLTLCGKFETALAEGDASIAVESESKKTITPPEKNLVSSIRQMHESLELEKKDGDSASKHRGSRISLGNEKVDDLSVNTSSPLGERAIVAQFNDPSQKSPELPGGAKNKEVQSPQGRPPRYKGKTRTPSESSLSENESTRSSGFKAKTEGSPKLRYDGSPKGQRQGPSNQEGSPKVTPHNNSPKGQRLSTQTSPKLGTHAKECAPALTKQKGSPTHSKAETSGSRIPVLRQTSSKDEARQELSPRLSGASQGIRLSWGSVESDSSKTRTSEAKQRISDSLTRHAQLGDAVSGSDKNTWDEKGGDTVSRLPTAGGQKLRDKSDKDKEEKKKRRGSIKELTNIFEEKIESLGKNASSPSPTQVKLRNRVRSASPNSATTNSPVLAVNVRHSMEVLSTVPTDVPLIGRHSDGNIKHGSLRMGPKPFYGAK